MYQWDHYQNQGKYYTSGTFSINYFDDRDFYKIPFRSVVNASQYENNLGPQDKFVFGGIQSDILNGDYLKLFVVYRERFDWLLEDSFNKFELTARFPDSITTREGRRDFTNKENKKYR